MATTHDTTRLVMTTDLNHHGFLFGGTLLSWVDEASFIAASLDFPTGKFVTIGMDEVTFKHGVSNGAILIIRSKQQRLGRTSVTYLVEVFCGRKDNCAEQETIFSTHVTFVNVGDNGEKKNLPI